MVANFCTQTPLLLHDPRVRGQKIKISVLSEHGQVAYQIKGNHECSNMVTNILLADTPLPKANLGVGNIGYMFCAL